MLFLAFLSAAHAADPPMTAHEVSTTLDALADQVGGPVLAVPGTDQVRSVLAGTKPKSVRVCPPPDDGAFYQYALRQLESRSLTCEVLVSGNDGTYTVARGVGCEATLAGRTLEFDELSREAAALDAAAAQPVAVALEAPPAAAPAAPDVPAAGSTARSTAPPEDAASPRPAAPSVAVGLGYAASGGGGGGGGSPATLAPTLASLRVRIAEGAALQPALAYRNTREGDRSVTELSADLQARIRAAHRGAVDASVIVGTGVTSSDAGSSGEARAGDAHLDVGLGLEAFLSQHWSLGLDATQSVFSMQSDADGVASGITLLGVSPEVSAWLHLYL